MTSNPKGEQNLPINEGIKEKTNNAVKTSIHNRDIDNESKNRRKLPIDERIKEIKDVVKTGNNDQDLTWIPKDRQNL